MPFQYVASLEIMWVFPMELIPIQIVFETFIFSLICWNALMRPRYAHNKLVQQLYIDGVVYFLVSIFFYAVHSPSSDRPYKHRL
jgi:hypothetical protein